MGASYFFGIGISIYDQFSHLNNGAKDVTDVGDLLCQEFQFERENIKLLLDEEATRENILVELDNYKSIVTPADELVIYFSGHGSLDADNARGFWMPHDAKKGNSSSHIRNSAIKDYLEDIDSLHTLLLADACYAGTLLKKMRTPRKYGKASADDYLLRLNRNSSRLIFCSGRHDEQVEDGKVGENSPFAEAIIKALHKVTQPGISFTDLVADVKSKVGYNSEQIPVSGIVFGSGHDGGEFVFWRNGHRPSEAPPKKVPYVTPKEITSKGTWRVQAGIILSLLLIGTVIWYATKDPDIEASKIDPPDLAPLETGSFIDGRDGEAYNYILARDSNYWMTDNVRYELPDDYSFPGNDKTLADAYGLLYDWKTAQLVCPADWALPTMQDWEELATAYGGYEGAEGVGDIGNPTQAFNNLIEGGIGGFNIRLAGYERKGEFSNLGYSTAFWTKDWLSDVQNEALTTNDIQTENAWVLRLALDGNTVVRRTYRDIEDKLSCRCIKRYGELAKESPPAVGPSTAEKEVPSVSNTKTEVPTENTPIEYVKTYSPVKITHNGYDPRPRFFINDEALEIRDQKLTFTVVMMPLGPNQLTLQSGTTECVTPVNITGITTKINISCS